MPALPRKALSTQPADAPLGSPVIPICFTLPEKLAEQALKYITDQNDGFLLSYPQLVEMEQILGRNMRSGRQMVDAVRALKILAVGGIDVDVPINVWSRLKSRYPNLDDGAFATQIVKVVNRLLEEHTNLR